MWNIFSETDPRPLSQYGVTWPQWFINFNGQVYNHSIEAARFVFRIGRSLWNFERHLGSTAADIHSVHSLVVLNLFNMIYDSVDQILSQKFQRVKIATTVLLYPSHKCRNAPVPYPTMYQLVTGMCTTVHVSVTNVCFVAVHISVTNWCIVGYVFLASWDGTIPKMHGWFGATI